jgi:predicted nucleotidyltransferase
MNRETAIEKIRSVAGDIRSLGVDGVYLFGSTERGEARTDSDVDLFVDYRDPDFSLIELARLRRILTAALGAEADVTTRGGLHPLLRDRIVAGATRVL